MLNLLTFVFGIAGIFLIARYNRSNKLFWYLVMAMLAGFVGGSIGARVTNATDKKDNTAQICLMQMPVAPTAYADFEMPSRTLVVESTKSAGRIESVSDAVVTFDPLTDLIESDVGNQSIVFNTS